MLGDAAFGRETTSEAGEDVVTICAQTPRVSRCCMPHDQERRSLVEGIAATAVRFAGLVSSIHLRLGEP